MLLIETMVLEAIKNQVAIWVPIFIVFTWLLRWVMQESKRREDRSHERENMLMQHNEKYQQILERQSDLIEQQNNIHKGQSEQLKELAGIINQMKFEIASFRERLNELWSNRE